MTGEGAILEMIRTLRGNKNLLRSRRFGNNRTSYSQELSKKKLVFKKATPEQLAEIRNRLRRKNSKNRILLRIVMIISLMLTFLGWIWLQSHYSIRLFN